MAYTQYKFVIAWQHHGKTHWSTGSQPKDESRGTKDQARTRWSGAGLAKNGSREMGEAHQLNAKFCQLLAVCRTRIIDDDTTQDNEGIPHIHTRPERMRQGDASSSWCLTLQILATLQPYNPAETLENDGWRLSFLQSMQMGKITFTWLIPHRDKRRFSFSSSISIINPTWQERKGKKASGASRQLLNFVLIWYSYFKYSSVN